jgi:hypothetical protein
MHARAQTKSVFIYGFVGFNKASFDPCLCKRQLLTLAYMVALAAEVSPVTGYHR